MSVEKFETWVKRCLGGQRRHSGEVQRGRKRGEIDYRRQSPFSLCSASAGESRESKVAQSSLLPRSLNGWRSAASPPLATAATGLRSRQQRAPPEASWGFLHSSASTAVLCTSLPHFTPLPWRLLSSLWPPLPRGRLGHQRRSGSHFSLRARRPAESPRTGSIYMGY